MTHASGDGALQPTVKSRRRLLLLLAVLVLLGVVLILMPPMPSNTVPFALSPVQGASAASTKPFDMQGLTIPKDEIYNGGPGKDGIPALMKPEFATVMNTTYLRPDDELIGVVIGDEARAYPLRVLVWHEIVNDTVGGVPIAVTYCPLCGTAMVFDRRVNDQVLTFGVSGLLYQSDVLFYDHQQNGLWSQLELAAVSGPLAGAALTWLPSKRTRWSHWRKAYPESQVLTKKTGYARDYDEMPYGGYEEDPKTIFPVPNKRTELSTKTWVVGLLVNGAAQAYPKTFFNEAGGQPIEDTIGGVSVRIGRDEVSGAIRATTAGGEVLPVVEVYWFAWQAFYPNTGLHSE